MNQEKQTLRSQESEISQEELLTVDYNNLYKLESSEDTQPSVTYINPEDIQFDSVDYVQDDSELRQKEKRETKKNIIFMGIIFLILIVITIFLFPIIFKFISNV